MNKMTAVFCWTVSRLDYIPRYGRLYYIGKDPKTGRWTTKKQAVRWKWQKHGRWGFNFLDKMNLLWPYLYHTNPDLLEHDKYSVSTDFVEAPDEAEAALDDWRERGYED